MQMRNLDANCKLCVRPTGSTLRSGWHTPYSKPTTGRWGRTAKNTEGHRTFGALGDLRCAALSTPIVVPQCFRA